MLRRSLALIALASALFGACTTPQAPPAPSSAEAVATAPAPVATPAPEAPPPPAEPSAAPSASASAEAEPAPPPEAPLPDVEVKNIGMHIGGRPNDAETKAPIRRSVEPHFDAFKRCYAKIEGEPTKGDFGLDLRIEKDGGLAKSSHPRTALKGQDFKTCVIAVFDAIVFEKPKGGATVVSYSLRFTPAGAK